MRTYKLPDPKHKLFKLDGIVYSIDEESKIAKVIGEETEDGKLLIPRSIIYKEQEYIITSISKKAFNHSEDIRSIEFPPDSEVRTIEDKAFSESYIENISLPSSIVELGKRWCSSTHELESITISPNNRYFKVIDDSYVVGKTSIEKEEFDVFLYCVKPAKKVVIPSSIEIIKSFAFDNYRRFESIEFEKNSKLRLIEEKGFYHTSCKIIEIPPHVKTIYKSTFKYCENLKEIIISEDSELETIEKDSLCFCSVEKIFIPSKLTDLQDMWCGFAKHLNEVKISPNNPRYKMDESNSFIIGKSSIEQEKYDVLVFSVRNIINAKIPEFIEIIGTYAFNNCKQLQTVEFPKESKIRIIGSGAFKGSSIEFALIPSSVIKICDNAFSYCSNLKTIEFESESKLEIIEKEAFFDSSIEKITIPSQVTEIDVNTFNRSQLNQISFAPNSKLQKIGASSFSMCLIEKIVIPSTVTKICEGAFSDCKNLQKIEFTQDSQLQTICTQAFNRIAIESISFPASLIDLEDGWCNKELKLIDIKISPNNPRYKMDESNSFIIGKSSIEQDKYDVLVFSVRNIINAKIPEFIKIIGPFAFLDCELQTVEFPKESKLRIIDNFSFTNSSIDRISIPSTVTKFGVGPFSYCKHLKSVEFEPDSKLEIIEEKAFTWSTIEKFSSPPHLTHICEEAFAFCNRLRNFESNSDLSIIEKKAFLYTDISFFSIPVHLKTIHEYVFEGCEKLKMIEFPMNSEVQTIENSAFRQSSITSLVLPPQVEKISSSAFWKCSNFQILEIDENSKLTHVIDEKFFMYCYQEEILIMIHQKCKISSQFENESRT